MPIWDKENINAPHTERELGMSDLVNRLRHYAETRVMGCQLAYPAGLNEAADRIEWLERELSLWKEREAHIANAFMQAQADLAAEKALADRLYEDSLGELCSDAAYVAYRKARGL